MDFPTDFQGYLNGTNTPYPPNSLCFATRPFYYVGERPNCTFLNYTITDSMVSFLNLTSDERLYRQAYCVAPPSDDICPFGYCPNSDIAGEHVPTL